MRLSFSGNYIQWKPRTVEKNSSSATATSALSGVEPGPL